MRFWLFVLILAIALSSVPLLKNNSSSYMRSALSVLQRSIPIARAPFAKALSAGPVQAVQHLQHSSTAPATHHSATPTATMTGDALPQRQQNPMPILEKAGPADAKKAEGLPKLSAEDFRVYNRLAVMMDAYVIYLPTAPLSL